MFGAMEGVVVKDGKIVLSIFEALVLISELLFNATVLPERKRFGTKSVV